VRKRTVGVLATSVALCALCVAIDTSAFGRGGGGGGGFHGGGGGGGGAARGGFGAFHGGGFAGHGFIGHAFAGHSLGGRGFAVHGGHGLADHRVAGQGSVGGRGNVGRFSAGHGLADRNGLAAHNFAAGRHQQFAAQHFQGLNNFTRTGFNRNAFGNRQAWNGWGGRFWGAGWNNWGSGWGGWAGPVFWPFLFGDIVSFVLYPYDYYDPFWAFGPDFVLASIFAPGPYFGPDYGYGPDYYGYEGFPGIYYGTGSGYASAHHVTKSRRVDRAALAQTNVEAMQSCRGLAPGVTDLPIEQIRQIVHPTAEQDAALDDLASASSKATAIVEESCPKEIPLTPLGRLDAAEKRLDAMIQAVQIVHSPLEKFYDSLSDEQRQRFDAIGSSRRAEGERSFAAGGDLAKMCSQQAGGVNVPVQRIEQVVAPNAQQQGAFDDLKKTSEIAAEQFKASCPTQMPQSPVARLDAVKTRLNGMVDAMKTIRPKLADFYASLSDEQKARFNTIGPPPQNASSQPYHQSSGR
jgi:hypothetical protein